MYQNSVTYRSVHSMGLSGRHITNSVRMQVVHHCTACTIYQCSEFTLTVMHWSSAAGLRPNHIQLDNNCTINSMKDMDSMLQTIRKWIHGYV